MSTTLLSGASVAHSSQSGFVGRILAAFKALRQRMRLEDELARMSDRELADIGMSRYDVLRAIHGEGIER
jgi:uncharacterized protein YjiS (DUF1127 family)